LANVKSIVAAAAAVLIIVSGNAVAADAEAGKAAYALCAACHGANGEGNQAMNAPRLAGQEPWYFERQLAAYRSGLRGTAPGDTPGMQMRPMAMTVTDPGALENLAAYVAAMPEPDLAVTVEGDVAAGARAYAVCAACHGAQAEGNEQMAGPRLAGQSDWYLVRQLQNYRKGLRAYDPKDIYGNQMKPMAMTLADDQAINDLVAYINSLR
jgi:cytochrome c oxidase subunit II